VDTSLSWLYEHEDKYRQSTGNSLWSISDWHNDPGDIALPVAMLSALKVDSTTMMRYRFLDNINATKRQIASCYRECFSVGLKHDNLAFCQNGTSALNLSIRSLAEEGVRRVLVITPAYFSLFSVLDLYGLSTVYVHSDLIEDSAIDVDRILRTARDQLADAIFLTNPIFSTGRGLSAVLVRDFVQYAERTGCWLILDETLAGLPWHSDSYSPFVTPGMHEVLQCSRSVYIWSVSKSLFLNGLKHSLVHAPNHIIRKIEKAADLIVGGLTAHQIALAEQIYCPSSIDEAHQCARKNIVHFSAAYDLCATCLSDSSLQLTSVNSGFHTIAFLAKPSVNATVIAQKIAIAMIRRHGISAIPLAHFGFPPFGPIGFRINLSKNPGKLHDALFMLAEIINKDPDLAH
jgi:aspartate/methionine/tyrosine aminotransferase